VAGLLTELAYRAAMREKRKAEAEWKKRNDENRNH
jgi:hypothetical protein